MLLNRERAIDYMDRDYMDRCDLGYVQPNGPRLFPESPSGGFSAKRL